MKNFLKFFFAKREKHTQATTTEPLTEKQILDILSNAICDVGYWSWWAIDLPKIIQVEFGGTQLYFPPPDSLHPPTTQIAIQFRNPKSISFLTRSEITSEDSDGWFDKLHNDEMDALTCSYQHFTFTDKDIIKEILEEARTIKTIYGYSPMDGLFTTEKYKLAFWAGDYGFAVSAEEIKVLTKDGDVGLEQIPEVHSQWWSYWRKYWDFKDTENALPKDYACEVTIPLKNN